MLARATPRACPTRSRAAATPQSRSGALPYEYDYNCSLTRESQLPAELAARGLSIRAVQQHFFADHSSAVKCAHSGRQITEEVDGVTVAADHGIHAAVGNWCEEFQWRFEAASHRGRGLQCARASWPSWSTASASVLSAMPVSCPRHAGVYAAAEFDGHAA